MSKKNKAGGLPIGGPSLLMVFVLLCINIFAVVSYMSALRDDNLSEKAAENISQYYMADAKAEEMLAKLAGEFKQNPEGMEKFVGINKLSISKQFDETNVEYYIPVKKEMLLKVIVKFSKETPEYDVMQWKLVNTHVIEDNGSFLELPSF